MKWPIPFQLITPMMIDAIRNNIPASTIPQLPRGSIVVKNGKTFLSQFLQSINPDQPVILYQSTKPTINIKNAIPNTISVHLRLFVIGGNASLSNVYFSLNCTSDIYTTDF